jgi:predicted dehydrogenase
MSQRLKVAVVGTGLIATVKHFPALQNLSDAVEVCAVCDVNEQQAQEAAAGLGGARVYTDLAKLLSTEKPDVVDICTPPKLHAPMALQSLEAGAHLVIEKPMCQTVEECDRVMELAAKLGRKICIAHSDLFYPSFSRARKMVSRGEIGTLRGMRIHLSTPVDYITSKPEHWAHKLPGGVFGESGPHVVYMTLAYMNPITEVHAFGRKLLPEYPWSPFEDYRVELVGRDITCTATMIYTTKQWGAEVELWGTDGTIRMDLESQTLIHRTRDELKAIPVGLSALGEAAQILTSGVTSVLERVTGRYVQTHQELLKAFAHAIVAGEASPVPPEEGRESIRVMNQISQQLDTQVARAS